MPDVYAVHHPVYYNRRSRTTIKMDLDMAEDYGNLKVIFPGDDRPPPIEECWKELQNAMKGFRPCDRLLLIGDMDLTTFAAILASEAASGDLTLLKWDNRNRRYYEVKAPQGLL